MGLLTCACLNVRIHVKGNNLTQASNIENGDDSSFFRQRLGFAHLNLEGIEQVHNSLVSKKRHGAWDVHRCSNCQMSTHAIHNQQPAQLLVNLCLHNDPSAISALENSVDFSPLYKIVLRDVNANRTGTVGVESEKYESLQQVLTTVQQQLNKFLQQQENDMETRIKRYEESQRAAFAELQRKARQDKNTMIHMILSAEQDVDANTTTTTPGDATTTRTTTTTTTTKSALSSQLIGDRQMGFGDETDNMNPVNVRTVNVGKTTTGFNTQPVSKSVGQQKHSDSKPPSGFQTRSASALSQKLGGAPTTHRPAPRVQHHQPDAALFDEDPLFGGDQDISSHPFYHSDDEQEDTDDSEIDTPPPANINMFSTSVPISVPAFTKQRKITFADENYGDPIGDPGEDPEDIAASIKALARSVHGDGKDVFGELPRRPRPKYNQGAADFSNM